MVSNLRAIKISRTKSLMINPLLGSALCLPIKEMRKKVKHKRLKTNLRLYSLVRNRLAETELKIKSFLAEIFTTKRFSIL